MSGMYSEQEIDYAQDQKTELYYKILDNIVESIKADIREYATFLSIVNEDPVEEPPLDYAIETLCEELFDDLEQRLLKEIK